MSLFVAMSSRMRMFSARAMRRTRCRRGYGYRKLPHAAGRHFGRHESRHPRFQEKREKVSRISGVRREYDERLAVG
jgi:hypothetical protein